MHLFASLLLTPYTPIFSILILSFSVNTQSLASLNEITISLDNIVHDGHKRNKDKKMQVLFIGTRKILMLMVLMMNAK